MDLSSCGKKGKLIEIKIRKMKIGAQGIHNEYMALTSCVRSQIYSTRFDCFYSLLLNSFFFFCCCLWSLIFSVCILFLWLCYFLISSSFLLLCSFGIFGLLPLNEWLTPLRENHLLSIASQFNSFAWLVFLPSSSHIHRIGLSVYSTHKPNQSIHV